MNNTFNIKRFGLLLKQYLVENRKQLFFLTGVMWGVMILTAAFIGKIQYREIEAYEHASVTWSFTTLLTFYGFAFLCFSCIISSFMMSSFRSKRTRISSLMVPASMAEKFTVRFVTFIIGFFIAYCIGVLLADISFCIFLGRGITFPSLNLPHNADSEIMGLILFYQSLYALGSALWPRLSFFKTFLAIFAAMIILLIFAVSFNLPEVHLSDDFFEPFFWIMIPIDYALAWWRFRKIQLFQRLL